jgi:hypothetical protein
LSYSVSRLVLSTDESFYLCCTPQDAEPLLFTVNLPQYAYQGGVLRASLHRQPYGFVRETAHERQ